MHESRRFIVNMKRKSIGIWVVLIVCIVAIVVLIVGVNKHDGSQHSHISKTVDSICTPTDYKQACITTMKSLNHTQIASPTDVINAGITAIIHEVTHVTVAGASFFGIANVNVNLLNDCNELLGFALDDLNDASTMVVDSDLETIRVKKPDLMNWLSAVVAYQETCLDGFNNEPELSVVMSNVLLNVTQLTSNALSIVDAMVTTGDGGGGGGVRRLLDTDNGGYPRWLSVADRKLISGNVEVRPNAVVAKDGSGQFITITDALAAYPQGHFGRYVVYVKEGVYDECVKVTKEKVNVFMYGDGPTKTIVTGNRSFKSGWATFNSATFWAIGNGFVAKSMSFHNTAGPEADQAVALQSQSDKSAFYDVHIEGYQDTLYTHTHRQFYTNCVISGTVDFIFGDGAVIIQNSLIVAILPRPGQKNTITAQGRKLPQEATGLVIQNCRIMAGEKLFPVRFQVKSYLGRPWKEYSRTVVMESTVDDFIQTDGWLPMQGDFALDTCFYGEYANVGSGAAVERRVKWKGFKVITDRNEAMTFTAGGFVQGNEWLRETGAPFYLGLKG